MMKRREFMKTCALGGGSVMLGGVRLFGGADAPRTRPPNVLFILADQWRFSAMSHGEHHDAVVRTPNLDAFAAQAVEWTRCYAAHPLCTPNRAAIITGRWPWETGMNVNNLMLPPGEKCIAHVFTDHGYRCHYIGKWHMDGPAKPGFVPRNWRRRGFTTFVGFNRGHRYMDSKTFSDDGRLLPGLKGRYEPTVQTDLAIEFIRKNRDRPFFCYLSWGPPHTPYHKHPAGFRYDPADIRLRPNVPPGRRHKARRTLAGYYAHCTALDHEFRRLMDALEKTGTAENTLIVFTADHGDMHYSHDLLYKQHPQEESWHVPLIMKLPANTAPRNGRKVHTPISSADLMPTILSICGLDVPDTCSGSDKSGEIAAPGSAGHVSVYGGVRDKWRAVVKGDYKLIVLNSPKARNQPAMLYDLRNDPYELHNLIDDPKTADVRRDLLAEIAKWKEKTRDPFPERPRDAKRFYEG